MAGNPLKDAPYLLSDIAKYLEDDISIFLIGGANLHVKGLKDLNDYDIVVLNRTDFTNLVCTLKSLEFTSINDSRISSIETILPVTDLLTHEKYGMVNIFELIVKQNACYISQRMISRTSFLQKGKLKIGLLHNNDIFLLKAMAAREKDFVDLQKILQQPDFDYDIVYDEMVRQERETGHNLSDSLFDAVDYLATLTGTKPACYPKLFRKMLDRQIEERVRRGSIGLETLVKDLQGGIIDSETIRKRIAALNKKKRIGIIRKGDELVLRPRDANVLNIQLTRPRPDSDVICKRHIRQIIQTVALYLPDGILEHSEMALSKLRTKSLHEGHKSQMVAAAAVYFGLKNSGRKYFSRGQIAEAAKVSNTSLGHYLEKIGSAMEK